MAYWQLIITDKNEPTPDDLSHIADLVLEGFTEGELNDDDESDDDND